MCRTFIKTQYLFYLKIIVMLVYILLGVALLSIILPFATWLITWFLWWWYIYILAGLYMLAMYNYPQDTITLTLVIASIIWIRYWFYALYNKTKIWKKIIDWILTVTVKKIIIWNIFIITLAFILAYIAVH